METIIPIKMIVVVARLFFIRKYRGMAKAIIAYVYAIWGSITGSRDLNISTSLINNKTPYFSINGL
jgi:hypothetical protein